MYLELILCYTLARINKIKIVHVYRNIDGKYLFELLGNLKASTPIWSVSRNKVEDGKKSLNEGVKNLLFALTIDNQQGSPKWKPSTTISKESSESQAERHLNYLKIEW